jgi:hypothetical protein
MYSVVEVIAGDDLSHLFNTEFLNPSVPEIILFCAAILLLLIGKKWKLLLFWIDHIT